MNKPTFERAAEREFLLAQLSPNDCRRVCRFMRENSVTASDAILMLGIGRTHVGRIVEVSDQEYEFVLSQLSTHERSAVERALVRHPEWTLGQCIGLLREGRL